MRPLQQLFALLCALVLLPAGLRAQHPPPTTAPEAEPAWSGNVGLSYLATGGNTQTESFGLDLEAQRRPTPWGLDVSALFHRAEEDGTKTAERTFAGLRGKRTLSERWEIFAGLSAENDDFAGIDLRSIVEAGATYKALPGPRHLLALDIGLTWTDENRLPPAPDEESLGGLAGLSYAWKIGEGIGFAQHLAYRPNFDNSRDWRADALTSLTTALNRHLAMKLSYELRYRHEPIGANDDTDTTTKVSLVWNL